LLCSCDRQPEAIWDVKITEKNLGEIVEVARATGKLSDNDLRLLEARITNPELEERSPLDRGYTTVLDAIKQQRSWEEHRARDEELARHREALTVKLDRLVISGTDTGHPWTIKLTYVNTSKRVIRGFDGRLVFDFRGDFAPEKPSGSKTKQDKLFIKEPAAQPTPIPGLSLQGIEVKAKNPFRPIQPGASLRVERRIGESKIGDPRWPSGTYSLEELSDLGVTVTWQPNRIHMVDG